MLVKCGSFYHAFTFLDVCVYGELEVAYFAVRLIFGSWLVYEVLDQSFDRIFMKKKDTYSLAMVHLIEGRGTSLSFYAIIVWMVD